MGHIKPKDFVALLLCCLLIPTLIRPSICHCRSSNLNFLSPVLSIFLGLEKWRSLLAFIEKGMKMFIHLEGIRAMIKEKREYSAADATSASLVHGLPVGIWPTHQENKK